MDETRIRFVKAIAERYGAEHIVELHLFSPIRQGVLETGVAVVAVEPGLSEAREEAQQGAEEESAADAEPTGVAPETAADTPSLSPTVPVPVSDTGIARLVVVTARYRLTRKGPDRGKWLFEAAPTADAPLATVDVVARGVTLRAKDVTETERLSGDQLRALLEDPQWRTPT
ncbi:MAG: hypothetical protein H3C62_08030 [Gemmatimonadaceae bacterium]|nr:hypothetical protein [Gemmatimonadaceae bacterium]